MTNTEACNKIKESPHAKAARNALDFITAIGLAQTKAARNALDFITAIGLAPIDIFIDDGNQIRLRYQCNGYHLWADFSCDGSMTCKRHEECHTPIEMAKLISRLS